MFGFDTGYALFDITPVDNQFISEYLPQARGDYVKVYLYGLMRCYHQEEDLNLERVSRELSLSPDDIQKAYRYWERQGLVRRISDQPPAWQYIHAKQTILAPKEELDPAYEAFSSAIYDVFDNGRRLHGSEIQTCYEWVEELGLPTEVVIMLLKHMALTKGKNFSIRSADQMAARMADEHVCTLEDAEAWLSRDQQVLEGTKTVLRKLGKRGLPSEAQLDMYRKWRDEWRIEPAAIEAACALTAKGEPSIGYLDGILAGVREACREEKRITPAMLEAYQRRGERLKKVLSLIGTGVVTPENKVLLEEMEEVYPQEIIEIGAKECAQSGKDLADLKKLLESWRKKGLNTREEVEAYVRSFRAQNELLKQLREIWNSNEPRIGEASRNRLVRWQELGFSPEMILQTAPYAAEAQNPMAYLDKVLTLYAQQGIRTPEAAEAAHQRFRESVDTAQQPSGGRRVAAQDYEQRDYTEKAKYLMDRFIRMSGEDPDA